VQGANQRGQAQSKGPGSIKIRQAPCPQLTGGAVIQNPASHKEVGFSLCCDRSKFLTIGVCVHTISGMEITFDAVKDAANIAKHGVSLAQASDLEWDWLLAVPDTRCNYGEARVVGYAPIGARVFCVVFTERGEKRRIISLRKANEREVRRYVFEN